MTRAPPKDPLIAIIGATGTGKSQLAVELAKRYNGEVVNADAMQLYADLPIITNKISVEERQGIPHHLLGCIGLQEQTWVVGTFVRRALSVIGDIRSRGKLPILVGGTHYYTQSLLFRDRLAENEHSNDLPDFVPDMKLQWPILQQPTEVLLNELRRVDPVMADRWHPNDRRKIQRSLEIYLQTGKKASDIYAEQREAATGLGGAIGAFEDTRLSDVLSLRFPTLILWVHAEKSALRERLEDRVDKMIADGLLAEVEELSSFADSEVANGVELDQTRGIWVSIGYKEFRAYAAALQDEMVGEQQLEKLKEEAVEKTQIATRQYAKRQLSWIRIKLINALAQAKASHTLYLLDGSDVPSFDTDVVEPSIELAHNFLCASSPMPEPASISNTAREMLVPKRAYDHAATPERWIRQHCEFCGVTSVTEDQWTMHTKSKSHRKLKAKEKAKGAGSLTETKQMDHPGTADASDQASGRPHG